ncbi:CPBP family intramembrane metalloprotease [Myxococcota bacterium]|nr:CPBP family intramembrane metalloprotease [Myxococcota bacterium]
MQAVGLKKALLFYGAMGAIAFLAIFSTVSDWELFWGTPWMWGRNLLMGLGVGVGLTILSRLTMVFFEWARKLTDEFKIIFSGLKYSEIALIALASGVAEEALFRGVLQPALGLWIATAIFGVLHVGPNSRFLPWTAQALGAGLLFGLLFIYTDGLLAPTVAHVSVNYLNLRLFIASPRSARDDATLVDSVDLL